MKSLNTCKTLSLLLLLGVVIAQPAFAAGGLSGVDNTLETIKGWLLGIGVVVCTLAFIWLGFKMMYQNIPFTEVSRVFGGALFVGCSATIASLVLG